MTDSEATPVRKRCAMWAGLNPRLRTLMSTSKSDFNHRRLIVTKGRLSPFDPIIRLSYNLDLS
jgi:hypothetical protein